MPTARSAIESLGPAKSRKGTVERDQLGLRLEKKKGQAEVLVVDHAEKTVKEN
jgi:uncharacterized protein (TIGR03435 family)